MAREDDYAFFCIEIHRIDCVGQVCDFLHTNINLPWPVYRGIISSRTKQLREIQRE